MKAKACRLLPSSLEAWWAKTACTRCTPYGLCTCVWHETGKWEFSQHSDQWVTCSHSKDESRRRVSDSHFSPSPTTSREISLSCTGRLSECERRPPRRMVWPVIFIFSPTHASNPCMLLNRDDIQRVQIIIATVPNERHRSYFAFKEERHELFLHSYWRFYRVFFLNTWTIWKVFTEMWGHMETLLLARLPTHTRMRIIYEEFICSHTYTLITPCDFTSCTPTHVNIVSASGCACIAALSLAKLARKTLLHSPAPKKYTFCLFSRTQTHRQTHIQAGGKRMWMGWAKWKAGIMFLTGRLSDLSEAAEKHPGSRHPLTQMTNVHWEFPIPLLSARTNTSHCV